MTESCTLVNLTGLCFGVLALMDPLFNGHTVIAYEGANDASTWINLIKKHQCTILLEFQNNL